MHAVVLTVGLEIYSYNVCDALSLSQYSCIELVYYPNAADLLLNESGWVSVMLSLL